MTAEPRSYAEGDPHAAERASPSGFGRYHVFARLGPSPLADAFLAVARGLMGLDTLTVLKRLRPGGTGELADREAFLDEARLAARLHHPHVIPLHEVGESHGSLYFAAAYVEGQPLDAVITAAAEAGVTFEPTLAARVIADACSGLAHAHELRDYDGTPIPVYHRDLSARAVRIGYDGRVTLSDFGLARAARSTTDSQSWKVAATSGYVAHDQAMGGAPDDLFAMGMVLWELLARRPLMIEAGEPSPRSSRASRASPELPRSAQVPSIARAAPGVDPRMEAIVTRALEKDPQRRFETAREMRDALERYIDDSLPPRPVEGGGEATKKRPLRAADLSAEMGRRVAHLLEGPRQAFRRHVERQMDTLRSSAPAPPGVAPGLSLAALDRAEREGGVPSFVLLDLSPGSEALYEDALDLAATVELPPALFAATRSKGRAGGSRRALWLLVPLAVAAASLALFAAR